MAGETVRTRVETYCGYVARIIRRILQYFEILRISTVLRVAVVFLLRGVRSIDIVVDI